MSNDKERRRIVGLWDTQQASVLVTLIASQGSSYRRVGARLLLTESGAYAGTVSGGCLESDLLRKATWATRHGAVIEHYSTAFDDTSDVPYGLGCGGEVDLLLEPAHTSEAAALHQAMSASLSAEVRVIATWLPREGAPLRRAVWDDTGTLLSASDALTEDERHRPPQQTNEIFLERLAPPQRLLCFGAGDDAQPLAELASLLGWTVWVIDGRSQLARPERFPHAERVLVASSVEAIALRHADAVVLMTHSYEQDRTLLAGLLPKAPGYLGMLGARHRSSLLLSEAASLAGLTLAEACARVFSPVGLDLGGDGPESIALAIIAEIQAHTQGRLGRARRLSVEEVAEQIERGGVSRYLQVQCAMDVGA